MSRIIKISRVNEFGVKLPSYIILIQNELKNNIEIRFQLTDTWNAFIIIMILYQYSLSFNRVTIIIKGVI